MAKLGERRRSPVPAAMVFVFMLAFRLDGPGFSDQIGNVEPLAAGSASIGPFAAETMPESAHPLPVRAPDLFSPTIRTPN